MIKHSTKTLKRSIWRMWLVKAQTSTPYNHRIRSSLTQFLSSDSPLTWRISVQTNYCGIRWAIRWLYTQSRSLASAKWVQLQTWLNRLIRAYAKSLICKWLVPNDSQAALTHRFHIKFILIIILHRYRTQKKSSKSACLTLTGTDSRQVDS